MPTLTRNVVYNHTVGERPEHWSAAVTDLVKCARSVPVGDDRLSGIACRAVLAGVLAICSKAHVDDSLRRRAAGSLANMGRNAISFALPDSRMIRTASNPSSVAQSCGDP